MGVPDARLSAKTMQLLKVYRRSGVLARLPAAVKQIVPASGGGKKPTKKPSKGCMCAKIHKPVCGKDGKTYPNACMAKCAKVAIKEHKACAQNMEAARVFSTFLKGNSKWMSDFQKSWKCGSKMPIATTKKTVGTTKAAYAFKFSNGCAVTVVYDISKNSAKRESSKCSTGKCVDDISTLSKYLAQLKLPKTSTCANIYNLIGEKFGFSCKQSLKSLLGQDVSLADVCCATCMNMKKPKSTPKPKSC